MIKELEEKRKRKNYEVKKKEKIGIMERRIMNERWI